MSATSKPPATLPLGKNDLWIQVTNAIGSLVPLIAEFIRLLPDGFVLGTIILSLLSMCKSYGVLLFTMFEIMIIQRLFSTVTGGISPIVSGQNANALVCQPGFIFPNNMRISLLENIGLKSHFPSPPMFFISAVLTYIISSIQDFKEEITTLGGNLSTRTTTAMVLSSLFLFVVLAFRHSSGCDSLGILLISTILGIAIGGLIMFQNKILFGRDGINLLNMPIIVSAVETGKPMFVCASSQ
jgi:hypothetical protein